MQRSALNFTDDASFEELNYLDDFIKETSFLSPSIAKYLLRAKRAKHPDFPPADIVISRTSLLEKIIALKNMPEGARKQILYYSGPNSHAFCLDVKMKNGKLSILCVESAKSQDPREVLEQAKVLLNNDKVPNDIYVCEASVQKGGDGTNCAFIAYVALNQLAKEKQLHESLPGKVIEPKEMSFEPQEDSPDIVDDDSEEASLNSEDKYLIEEAQNVSYGYFMRGLMTVELRDLPIKISYLDSNLIRLNINIRHHLKATMNNLSDEEIKKRANEQVAAHEQLNLIPDNDTVNYLKKRRDKLFKKLKGKFAEARELVDAVRHERKNRLRQSNPILDLFLKSMEEPTLIPFTAENILKITQGSPEEKFIWLDQTFEVMQFDEGLYKDQPPGFFTKKTGDLIELRQALIDLFQHYPVNLELVNKPFLILDSTIPQLFDTFPTEAYDNPITRLRMYLTHSREGQLTQADNRFYQGFQDVKQMYREKVPQPSLKPSTDTPRTPPPARQLIKALFERSYAKIDAKNVLKPYLDIPGPDGGLSTLEAVAENQNKTHKERTEAANLYVRYRLLNYLAEKSDECFKDPVFIRYLKNAANAPGPGSEFSALLCASHHVDLPLQEKIKFLNKVDVNHPLRPMLIEHNLDLARSSEISSKSESVNNGNATVSRIGLLGTQERIKTSETIKPKTDGNKFKP